MNYTADIRFSPRWNQSNFIFSSSSSFYLLWLSQVDPKGKKTRLSFFFGIDQRIICYYTNWSVYRHTIIPVLYPDEIDPSLCTHIHFAFASIDPWSLKIEPSENHDRHFTNIFSTVCWWWWSVWSNCRVLFLAVVSSITKSETIKSRDQITHCCWRMVSG